MTTKIVYKKRLPGFTRFLGALIVNKIKIMPSGCWEWQAYKNADGYGVLGVGKKTMLAYRYLYKKLVGEPPIRPYSLDHLCRNRSCVNPNHLEVVLHKDNILRGESPAANYAKRKLCDKGHLLNGIRKQGNCRFCIKCRRISSYERVKAWRLKNREYFNEYKRQWKLRRKLNETK